MRKSQKGRNRTKMLSGLVIPLIFAQPHFSLARPRPIVDVRIETKQHVGPSHIAEDKDMNHIFRPLKLTYHIPATGKDKPIIISVPPGAGGLVVEHIAADGTRTVQSRPPEPWWWRQAERLEIESSTSGTYFSVWVLPGVDFDFSELGIYHISYVHPWANPQEDPNSPAFISNTLTIACVTQERSDQLHRMLSQNPELAHASYKFKNPPSVRENARYRRSVPNIIDEAIENGAKQDEVLFLVGSPDIVGYTATHETWLYETSPVGGYQVHFKDGCVVSKGKYADADGP